MLHGVEILNNAVKVTLGPKAVTLFSTSPTARRASTRTASPSPRKSNSRTSFEKHGAQMVREVRLQDQRQRRRRHDDGDDPGPPRSCARASSSSPPHEPDGPEARRRPRGDGVVKDIEHRAKKVQSSRKSPKSVQSPQWRQVDRRNDRQGDEERSATRESSRSRKGKDRRTGTRSRRGHAVDRGYLSPYFVSQVLRDDLLSWRIPTSSSREEAIVAAADVAVLERSWQAGSRLLIIAETSKARRGDPRRQQAARRPQGRGGQGPRVRDRRKAMLEDIAVLTAAR